MSELELERLARKSKVYIHINPGRCHEQQEDEGIPENVTGLLETTNQRSNSQRNASCNCQQCKPSPGIKCNKHERVDQDDGQSNEGMNNAVSLDHILKMRVRIQKFKRCRPGSSEQLKKGGEVGPLPGQRGRILHKLTNVQLTQVKKQNQEKLMPELKIALAVTNFFLGGEVRIGTDQGEKQILSMLALFTRTKFAGKFAD